jgi:predicted transcriptional regulator
VIPSSLSQANADPRLRGAPLAVYVWCLEHLDVFEFRPVKIALLQHELRIKEVTAYDAMKRLSEAGYLARGHRPSRGVRTYRLLASPAPVKVRAA